MNPDSEPYHLSLPLPRYCLRDEALRLGSSFSHFQGSVLTPPTLQIFPLQIFLPLALSTCVAPTLPTPLPAAGPALLPPLFFLNFMPLYSLSRRDPWTQLPRFPAPGMIQAWVSVSVAPHVKWGLCLSHKTAVRDKTELRPEAKCYLHLTAPTVFLFLVLGIQQ